MSEEILQINENFAIDESIEKYEVHEYSTFLEQQILIMVEKSEWL